MNYADIQARHWNLQIRAAAGEDVTAELIQLYGDIERAVQRRTDRLIGSWIFAVVGTALLVLGASVANAADVCAEWPSDENPEAYPPTVETWILTQTDNEDGDNPIKYPIPADILDIGCQQLDPEIGCDSCKQGDVLKGMPDGKCYQVEVKLEGDDELSPITDPSICTEASGICH